MNDFPEFDAPLAVEKRLLEERIQSACVDWARARGWYARKLSSPANRAIMDYLFGKDTWVELVEFKRPGIKCKLSPDQGPEHDKARACGMRPVVFDDVAAFKAYILRAEEHIANGDWVQWADQRGYMARGHERGEKPL